MSITDFTDVVTTIASGDVPDQVFGPDRPRAAIHAFRAVDFFKDRGDRASVTRAERYLSAYSEYADAGAALARA